MYIHKEGTSDSGHSLGGKKSSQGVILEVPGLFCVGLQGDPRPSIQVQDPVLELFHL